MAEQEKCNQDKIDGDILDLAVSVFERRGLGSMIVHELRGYSRMISGSREFTSMVSIQGHDVDEFIKHVNKELADVGMFSTQASQFPVGERTMIFQTIKCCDKMHDPVYRAILGSVYKTINLLTNFNPEEVNLMGNKDNQ